MSGATVTAIHEWFRLKCDEVFDDRQVDPQTGGYRVPAHFGLNTWHGSIYE